MSKEQLKKHRHKWSIEENDCHRCGYEIYEVCECGEDRDIPDKKLKPNVKRK